MCNNREWDGELMENSGECAGDLEGNGHSGECAAGSEGNGNNGGCASYLKKHEAYARLMGELWKKWKSFGRIAGSVTLKNTTEAERRAISGIIGKTLTGETVTISFQEFEQGLQKTRYAPIDMKAVLEAYFAAPLQTNQEQKERVQKAKDDFFERLSACFEGDGNNRPAAYDWLRELYSRKKYGYQILLKEWLKDPKAAEILGQNTGRALCCLEESEGEETLLAVFAADISGNPHYFDRGTVAGQLLIHAICFWKNMEVPQSAYQWRECMQSAGIVSDNIASMVHVFGLQLETADGLHPAYEAFYDRREPYVLTGENLKSITGANAHHNTVYVVENEMVFLYLVENTKDRDVSILCTSGQMRVAALKLLDHLVRGGALIRYSGDLDPTGMDIADRLWQRYGNAVWLWRMGTEDYRESISNEMLNDRQLAKLKRLQNAILCQTAELVQKEKKAGYQENLLKQMLGDVIKQ